MENLNKRTDLIELHKLEFYTNHHSTMFLYDCSMYKTKFDNVFITDFDLMSNEPLHKQGLLCLFYRDGQKRAFAYISIMMMDDVEYVNNFIKTQLLK